MKHCTVIWQISLSHNWAGFWNIVWNPPWTVSRFCLTAFSIFLTFSFNCNTTSFHHETGGMWAGVTPGSECWSNVKRLKVSTVLGGIFTAGVSQWQTLMISQLVQNSHFNITSTQGSCSSEAQNKAKWMYSCQWGRSPRSHTIWSITWELMPTQILYIPLQWMV